MSDDLLLEVKSGNLEGVKRLIAGGTDINSTGQFGWAALHLAIYDSQPDIIEWLLSRKPDVNLRAEDGGTPLHYAASYGDPDLIKRLIVDHHADVNIKNSRDQTPLAMAQEMNESENITEMLKKYGATI